MKIFWVLIVFSTSDAMKPAHVIAIDHFATEGECYAAQRALAEHITDPTITYECGPTN